MRPFIIVVAALLLMTSLVFALEEEKKMSLSAADIAALEIRCGAGCLEVHGTEGLSEIQVKALIVVNGRGESSAKKFIDDHVRLSLEKRGNRAVLVSEIDHHFSLWPFRDERIDLAVEIPKDMDLSIEDGSGSILVEKIRGMLEIEDGSGTIDVEGIGGSVRIDDGSGEINIRDVAGDISIDDGSGTIHVERVGGTVTVSDGSGSIEIENVEKDVNIKNDGSGGLHIRDVKGRVIK
jgi:DUF4097 and DUF4098 domain-containing protein YvlB